MRPANDIFIGRFGAPLHGEDVVGGLFGIAGLVDLEVVEHHRVGAEALVTAYEPVLYVVDEAAVEAACVVRAQVLNAGLEAVDRH